MPDFGWSYPPGVNSLPDDDDCLDWFCIVCDLPTKSRHDYCSPSCEQAWDDDIVATDFTWFDDRMVIPYVLARSYTNPFHIPNEEELHEQKP